MIEYKTLLIDNKIPPKPVIRPPEKPFELPRVIIPEKMKHHPKRDGKR